LFSPHFVPSTVIPGSGTSRPREREVLLKVTKRIISVVNHSGTHPTEKGRKETYVCVLTVLPLISHSDRTGLQKNTTVW